MAMKRKKILMTRRRENVFENENGREERGRGERKSGLKEREGGR